ncbi:hypothetical protein V3C99_018301 [Haemonchus contortus]|uniref:Uncharacterized protein n=1 Tax=Haemonchus contortus TaxID=6289 RepID=A0A7I4Z1X8_HAECO
MSKSTCQALATSEEVVRTQKNKNQEKMNKNTTTEPLSGAVNQQGKVFLHVISNFRTIKQTDRQTDGQTDRQSALDIADLKELRNFVTDIRTDRQTDGQTDRLSAL